MDRELLRAIARASVQRAARDEEWEPPAAIPPPLERIAGAFVSLKLRGRLRGCIGRVTADLPLWKVVAEVARAAAIEDPRFPPLSLEELEGTEIEVSVLGPLRRIWGPSGVRIGKDGLLIRKGARSGLLLPQVATELRLDAERFLDETCVKAGLARGDWREGADILAFDAEVF
jgi:AmmeMemoRadiSam system protein A